LLRLEQAAERRTADDRSSYGREAPAGRLPVAVGGTELRRGDSAARVRVGELAERRDAAVCGLDVGVRRDDVRRGRGSDAAIDVRPETERRLFPDDVGLACRRVAAGVGDEHELVDLRRERL